jgi:hypothetical protein
MSWMYILFKKWPLVTLVYVSECFQINLENLEQLLNEQLCLTSNHWKSGSWLRTDTKLIYGIWTFLLILYFICNIMHRNFLRRISFFIRLWKWKHYHP